MAGGQERILRRRIKTVQSTKKITRAMELIAASRIVKAQARVQAARPYANGITEVVRDLQAAGGGREQPAARRRATEIRTRRARRHRRRPRAVRRVQLAGDPRRRSARSREHAGAGRDYALVAVGRKAEGYFRFRELPRSTRRSPASATSRRYEDARAGRAAADRARSRPASSTGCSSSTRGSSRPAARRSSCEPLMPLDRRGPRRRGDDAERRRRRGYEFEPDPEAILDRAAAALRRGARLRRAAQRGRVGARGPPAGDEGRDRQRRRPHPRASRRVMNRARQDAITTEIMEIVGGAEALRGERRAHDDDARRRRVLRQVRLSSELQREHARHDCHRRTDDRS